MLLAFTTYLDTLDLVSRPLTVLMLLSALLAAYFTIVRFLGEYLSRITPDQERAELSSALQFSGGLETHALCVGILSATAIGLTLIRWIVPCPVGDTISVFCKTTNFLIPALTISALFPLGVLVVIAGSGTVRREANRLRRSLLGIEAVVCFKNGHRLRGGLYDLKMLQGLRYFRVRLQDGRDTWVDSERIAAVFLLEGEKSREAMQQQEFIKGPRSLVLKLGDGELFANTTYFDRLSFRVCRCYRKDTRTDYVIAPRNMLDSVG